MKKTPVRLHFLCIISGFLFFCLIQSGCTSTTELEWNEEEHYRWAEVTPGMFGRTGFKKLSPSQTNIDFVNRISEEKIDENRHYLNGSGVAAGDIDVDGLTDLYFAGLEGPNRLYRNMGGMRFEEITGRAGVTHEGYYSTGVVFADVNGNGFLDLLVTAMHRENVLYINDGKGNFTLKEDSGLGPAQGSTTMALADLTGNGYPDLYIARYKEKSVKDLFTTRELEWENILNEPLRDPTDSYSLTPPFDRHYELKRQDGELAGVSEIGEVDELYLNRGGVFEKVEDTREIFLNEEGEPFGLQPDWGLSAKFQDLTGNGLPDLYVCNDFHTPDRIWINQGEPPGTGIKRNVQFRATSRTAIRNLSFSCMGVDFSDINRDGELDIFTTEMLSPESTRRLRQAGSDDPVPVRIGKIESRPMYNRNSMYLKREDSTYAEITHLSGTEATGWSWATRFLDVNLDGYEDLLVNTGYLYDILDIDAQISMMQSQRNMDEHFMEFTDKTPPLELPNRILKNRGDLTFTNAGSEWGFSEVDISHGMAVVDLNNDGVLDLVMNRMNKVAAVYQNTTRAARIGIRLKGKAPNTQALGSEVELRGGPVVQRKQITAGGEYASGSDVRVMFAADPENPAHEILVTWPDGQESVIGGVKANRIYEIHQSSAREPGTESDKELTDSSISLFEDVTKRLSHHHHEEPFQDFELQPMLPTRLSQLGPGVAWIDVTGNHQDELLIGSGKGGQLGWFENRGDGQFEQLTANAMTRPSPGDQTAILGWKEDGFTQIVTGSANYEQGRSGAASAYLYRLDSSGTVVETDSLPGIFSTTGPLAASDVTGNGYLDIFVGGAFKPGQFPEDADSRLFRNEGGTFVRDEASSRLFEGLGLVNGAVFSDMTGNGRQDLLVSTGWGSLRLFENTGGAFREITAEKGLDAYLGWWQGVATGDLTGNGRPDIIATNIGRNSAWQIKQDQPIRMYHDDLNGDGRMDIMEAYPNEEGEYVPRHRLYRFQSQQILLNHMGSHKEFAEADVTGILGTRHSRIPYKEINTVDHMVFLNSDSENDFEAYPLPREAQFSAGFHVGVADIDNDGSEDLFMSQNLFAMPRQTPRLDAGRSILLLGDGQGNFRVLSGTESGVKVYGEQRGSAFSDVNNDGKVDLAVSQNGASTRLFLNRTKNTGYKISLNGPDSNRHGIGSAIRLVYAGEEKGPLREVQAGSGYWSQNSARMVMGSGNSRVEAIEVRWFDGTLQTVGVTQGEKNYMITHPEAQ
ncbi:MAG: FG-GAP-like repeat-containing protein [Balneolaceae bacterium]